MKQGRSGATGTRGRERRDDKKKPGYRSEDARRQQDGPERPRFPKRTETAPGDRPAWSRKSSDSPSNAVRPERSGANRPDIKRARSESPFWADRTRKTGKQDEKRKRERPARSFEQNSAPNADKPRWAGKAQRDELPRGKSRPDRAEKPRSTDRPRAVRKTAPPKRTVQSPQFARKAELLPGSVVVNSRAAARLRSGNPWGYRSDMISAEGVAPGSVAAVVDERGKLIGSGLYSSSSQIAVRLIDSRRVESEELPEILRQRIKAALSYRNRVVEASEGYRLVFSEADLLPGLIVDRYNDVLSMQVLTQAMDREEIRQIVLQTLVQETAPAGIVERVDARIREFEELPAREGGLIWGDKSATTFAMNGLTFQFEGLSGQKTGAFLDQRENYVAAARYANGEALDVFCYQGGFALHMARVCQRVTGVDSSRPALEAAETNLQLNQDELRARGAEVDWIEANAFDILRDYADAGRQYDTIVLDPPAFAKSKRALDTALRGYKELNLRGLKMVKSGGVFVTCSCSQHVSESDFLNMLADAAADVHRTVRIVEKRTQAKDHPVLLSMPETQYLKCVIAIVD